MNRLNKWILLQGLCVMLVGQALAQSFNVSPGVVRAFAENTISVKIDNWDCAQMQVRTDNGKIKKISDCKYALIPQRLGAVNISVSKVQNGAVIDLGIKRLTADGKSTAARAPENYSEPKGSITKSLAKEVIPLFQVSFNGRMSGELKRRLHFKNRKLDLLCEDSKALEWASIEAFRIVVIKGDVMEFEKMIDGDTIDTETLMLLLRQKDSRQLLFTGIRIKYKGKSYLIKDIEFEIK